MTGDVIAGLTLVAIAIPEQMATARLANMPALTGLYAFVVGSLMIAVFGASRQMSVGADSTIAPVVAAGVVTVAAAGTPQYQQLVAWMAVAVGVILLLAGLLKLGWIADFISTPVVTGILAGIAVEIFVRQLPSVLGLPGGGVSTIDRLREIARQLPQANPWTMGLAATVLVLIVIGERIDRRIPGALIGLAVAIAAASILHLHDHGVRVLGPVSGGLPSIGLPWAPFSQVTRLAIPAFTVAFLCLVQSAATCRSLSSGAKAAEALDHDLVGIGAANVAAGLIGSFPVNASPPRSAVVAASGGKSQVAGLVAAVVIVAVIAVATGVLANLPQAALGAILIFVATRLLHVKDLKQIRRFDAVEFGLTMVTIAVVAVFGIEQGIVVAFVLSMVDRTRLAARPRDAVLQRETGTDHWIPSTAGHPTERVPGVIVYLPLAPVWFGNAQYIIHRIHELIDEAPEPVRAFVLDAAGVADIDFTGARALDEVVRDLKQRGIAVGVARASGLVPKDLERSGLLKDLGPANVYPNVESAVKGLTGAQRR
ncbi:MAG TPA: SulP family inorganic anion transporter [Actinomycetota bacterium]|nr:SulP family inorganic anion transporter [Actinomycetota bacterium]